MSEYDIIIVDDPVVGWRAKKIKVAKGMSIHGMSTWEKAEKRYKEKGMSEGEISKYKVAWEKAHGKQKKRPSLGKGMAEGAAKAIEKRKSRLQQLEEQLDGKEF